MTLESAVPLRVAIEALADVLADYDVPTGRIIAEFKLTVAVYTEADGTTRRSGA